MAEKEEPEEEKIQDNSESEEEEQAGGVPEKKAEADKERDRVSEPSDGEAAPAAVESEVVLEHDGAEEPVEMQNWDFTINDDLPVVANEVLPEEISIIPLRQRPIFPGLTMPMQIDHPELVNTLKEVLESDIRVVGVVFGEEVEDEDESLYEGLRATGTVMRVFKAQIEDGSAQLLINSIRRFQKMKVASEGPPLRWKVEYFEDPVNQVDEEIKAYTMAVITSVKELLKLNSLFQEQFKMLLANITFDRPGLIMDLIASLLTSDGVKLQEVLETVPLILRAEKLLKLLHEEIQLFELQEKIKQNIEEKITRQQKEFFLHEQLKEIKKELGLEKDDKEAESEKFKERMEKLTLSEEARKVIDEEMNKLSLLEPASAEYNVSRTYLDWLTVLPWGVYSEDNFDIARAREVLDRDHYGLEDVKERILEFISTGIKTGNVAGSILCFVGPPGVGKTSIGKSVAQALGREFFRFSVGGMRDEAEIKGHRRTYIGAMPGKFIQSLKTVATSNPVIMLDEIDKIGVGFRGDPAGALLEVLDPEQNNEFLDHYLDVRFDLSHTLFIVTANQLDTIPPALLDRMEVLKLSGYIMEEKLEIARRYLIPNARKAHGLEEKDVSIDEGGLKFIIDRYAREAGVRNLENQIKKFMRRITLLHAEGNSAPVIMTDENVVDFLGQPVFAEEVLYSKSTPGVVLGLAWTSMGGATLYIEASIMASKNGGYKQTGQLGDVMRESAEIAYTLIRSRAERYNIDSEKFSGNFIHLHVPAGATPKDGPSAGITMSLALYSLLQGKPVRNNIAMTGEITLTGKVLPVGGIREKIIAARRVGIREIILPRENLKDYKELPEYIRSGLKVYFANYFEDVLKSVYRTTSVGGSSGEQNAPRVAAPTGRQNDKPIGD